MTETVQINALENEAIYIFREVAAQFEKPVLLFSGGKDSISLVRLAQKAFYPAKIPFPLMHKIGLYPGFYNPGNLISQGHRLDFFVTGRKFF